MKLKLSLGFYLNFVKW